MFRDDVLIVDHVKNIGLAKPKTHTTLFYPLKYLPAGIHEIAKQVRLLEIDNAENGILPDACGYMTFTDEIYLPSCYFEWFAVSVVNHLRLVALLEIGCQRQWGIKALASKENAVEIKAHCSKYVLEAVPDLLEWRHKIAAHYSITDPRRDDSVASLLRSVSLKVWYQKGRLVADGVTPPGKDPLADPGSKPWSLAERFEQLAPRFWPHLKLPPFQMGRIA
ncbi:MAG: hypothetical protein WC997_17865 [Porticoccaceae bacterium]